MKKTLYLFIFICTSMSLFAQQENHYTMFMYNKMMYNPAFAGAREVPSVMAKYRNQWINFTGAPQSQLVNFDTPLGKTRASVGVQLSRHTIGIERKMLASLAYSYALVKTKTTSFRLGLNGNFMNTAYDFGDPAIYIRDGASNDPSINQTSMTTFNRGNFGAGAYFDYKNVYAGFSIPNLYQNALGQNQGIQQRHMYATMGGLIPLSKKVQLRPSMMFRMVQNIQPSFDANLMAIFNKMFHIGGSYRLDSVLKSESVDFVAYFQPVGKLGVGVSYDLSVNKLVMGNKGTIEAMIRYDFIDPNTLGKRGKFDNPRFFF